MLFKEDVYFVSGIDTDAGKSYATAMLAKSFGGNIITQKFIQTGQDPKMISEDILTHRRLQGVNPLPEDIDKTTCPIIFKLPSSPHLAAKEENKTIDTNVIKQSTKKLLEKYDKVIIEGAGGLMVPITENYLTADYIVDNDLPLFLVATAKLGSLNHTLLSLEYCKSRNIRLAGVVYNTNIATNHTITSDTALFIKNYLVKNFPKAEFLILETLND